VASPDAPGGHSHLLECPSAATSGTLPSDPDLTPERAAGRQLALGSVTINLAGESIHFGHAGRHMRS